MHIHYLSNDSFSCRYQCVIHFNNNSFSPTPWNREQVNCQKQAKLCFSCKFNRMLHHQLSLTWNYVSYWSISGHVGDAGYRSVSLPWQFIIVIMKDSCVKNLSLNHLCYWRRMTHLKQQISKFKMNLSCSLFVCRCENYWTDRNLCESRVDRPRC